MAVIDSDAHVLETEHTWDYMLESERALKPRIVPTPNDASSGGESWLIDGTYIGKARNVGVIAVAFLLGRRKGRRRTTVVEVRRI